ncbi:Uncharacterised protein [Vibrio cholerae]|nr:Uncharacterised protein [Vibrio cholerae]CSI23988.1 Uncharacterised protein [Vibrio cholerae]
MQPVKKLIRDALWICSRLTLHHAPKWKIRASYSTTCSTNLRVDASKFT